MVKILEGINTPVILKKMIKSLLNKHIVGLLVLGSPAAFASPLHGLHPPVSVGNAFHSTLRPDGKVQTYGENSYYELGVGHNSAVTGHATVLDSLGNPIENIIQVSSGLSHTLAVSKSGRVYAWGRNVHGQLGDGTVGVDEWGGLEPHWSAYAKHMQTGAYTYLDDIIQVSAGTDYSLALRKDGTVWACGVDGAEQVGNGPNNPTTGPGTGHAQPYAMQVLTLGSIPLSGVVAVRAGLTYSLALKADGTVWWWGYDGWKISGRSTSPLLSLDHHGYAYQVPDLPPIIDIAVGGNAAFALTSDGKVLAWGNNLGGALGRGILLSAFTDHEAKPVMTSSTAQLDNVKAISVSANGRCMALRADGSVVVWGTNNWGSSRAYAESVPEGTGDLQNVVAISSGAQYSLAVSGNGVIKKFEESNIPAQPVTDSSFDTSPPSWSYPWGSIAAGWNHVLGLNPNGSVSAFGENDVGQLGTGTTSPLIASFPSLDPSGPTYPVGAVPAFSAPNSTRIVSLSSTGTFTLALDSAGTVWAWGDNTYGQLGTAVSGAYSATPVQVTGASSVLLDQVVSVEAGYEHCLAIRADGSVVSWGRNDYGQLGNSIVSHSAAFTTIPSLTGVTNVAAGNGFSLARTAGGAVYGWGRGDGYQLGTGTTTSSSVPALSILAEAVKSIDAGADYSIALASNGRVYEWGFNIRKPATSPSSLPWGSWPSNWSTPQQVPNIGSTATTFGPPISVSYISAGWSTGVSTGPGLQLGWGLNISIPFGFHSNPPPSRDRQPYARDIHLGSELVTVKHSPSYIITRNASGEAVGRGASGSDVQIPGF